MPKLLTQHLEPVKGGRSSARAMSVQVVSLIAVTAAVVALVGCSTKRGSDPVSLSFNKDDSGAIVVIGATSARFEEDYGLYFVGFNQAKNRLYSERNGKDIHLYVGRTSGFIRPIEAAHSFDGKDYYVTRVDPGSYYLFAAGEAYGGEIREVYDGSWAFTVNAGEVAYIGDFTEL